MNLMGLSLSDNSLNGTIPRSLAGLSSVVNLEIGDNRLSGHIPVEFGQLNMAFLVL